MLLFLFKQLKVPVETPYHHIVQIVSSPTSLFFLLTTVNLLRPALSYYFNSALLGTAIYWHGNFLDQLFYCTLYNTNTIRYKYSIFYIGLAFIYSKSRGSVFGKNHLGGAEFSDLRFLGL